MKDAGKFYIPMNKLNLEMEGLHDGSTRRGSVEVKKLQSKDINASNRYGKNNLKS
jgi:hypothetical protein